MTIKIKWIFLIVWLLSLAVFIVGQISAPSDYASISGNPWGAIFGTSVIVGILSFVLMIGFFAFDMGKGTKQKSEPKKFNWKFMKHPLSLIIALILVLVFVGTTLAYKYVKLNGGSISAILQKATPTPIPLPTVVITPAPTSTPNSNPVITCNVAKECGGGSQQLKKSVCDNKICCLYDSKCGGAKFVNKSECGTNITCCGLNDGTWVIMDNNKCNQVHSANKPATTTTTVVTQPSTGLNFYCYDNYLKYSYYTSSGEQCNKNKIVSGCKAIVKSTYDMCMKTCLDKANSDGSLCISAYFGNNAAIENNPALYKQCEDEVSANHQTCMDACNTPFQADSLKCNN